MGPNRANRRPHKIGNGGGPGGHGGGDHSEPGGGGGTFGDGCRYGEGFKPPGLGCRRVEVIDVKRHVIFLEIPTLFLQRPEPLALALGGDAPVPPAFAAAGEPLALPPPELARPAPAAPAAPAPPPVPEWVDFERGRLGLSTISTTYNWDSETAVPTRHEGPAAAAAHDRANALSTRALKAELMARGVSVLGLAERRELVEALVEARVSSTAAAETPEAQADGAPAAQLAPEAAPARSPSEVCALLGAVLAHEAVSPASACVVGSLCRALTGKPAPAASVLGKFLRTSSFESLKALYASLERADVVCSTEVASIVLEHGRKRKEAWAFFASGVRARDESTLQRAADAGSARAQQMLAARARRRCCRSWRLPSASPRRHRSRRWRARPAWPSSVGC